MGAISAFEILLLAHLVGDFLFQTQWMAYNKMKNALALIIHCIVYTAIVMLFSFLLLEHPLSLSGILLIFIGHIILDQGSFIRFWYKYITRSNDPKTGWLKIVYDQIFHLLLLYAALSIG